MNPHPIFARARLLVLALLLASAQPSFAATIRIASGLTFPTLAMSPEGDPRIFIVEQIGRIRLWKGGAVLPTPFLDIHDQVSCCGLQGMLGLVFHPNFASNGLFYVNYTDLAGDSRLVRFEVSGNPDVADPLTAHEILFIDQPHADHNGGSMVFGNDGYLYVAMGDGGVPNDPDDNSQNPQSLLGKILRLDVDGGDPYVIPPSNPFVGNPAYRPEIWALGLREPWTLAIDRPTGNLWIADVGQSRREELDFQAGTSSGGQNYGWKRMEGTLCFDPPTNCDDGSLTLPIYEYPHANGRCSISGGAVYHGSAVPSYTSAYFFGDYCTGRIWSCRYNGTIVTELIERTAEFAPLGGYTLNFVASIGAGPGGELLVCDWGSGNSGEVFRLSNGLTALESSPLSIDAITVAPNPSRGEVAIRWSGPSTAQLSIVDMGGRVIRRLDLEGGVAREGFALARWDGRDLGGREAPSGIYTVRVASGREVIGRSFLRLR